LDRSADNQLKSFYNAIISKVLLAANLLFKKVKIYNA